MVAFWFVLLLQLIVTTAHAATEYVIEADAITDNSSQVFESQKFEVIKDLEQSSLIKVITQGGNQSLLLLGSRSEDVSYFIGQMQLQDPTSPSGQFDLALLPTGIFSTLAIQPGASARSLAGEIHFDLKQNRKLIHASVSNREDSSFSLGLGKESFGGYTQAFLTVKRQESSFAASSSLEKDPQRNASGLLHFKNDWAELTYLGVQKESHYDGIQTEDENARSSVRFNALSAFIKAPNKSSCFAVRSQATFYERNENDAAEVAGTTFLQSRSIGKIFEVEPRCVIEYFSFGTEALAESYKVDLVTDFAPETLDKSRNHLFPWAEFKFDLENSQAQILLKNKNDKNDVIAQLDYAIGIHRIYFKAAMAHKLPTLYQLYSSYGNSNLHAESVQNFLWQYQREEGSRTWGILLNQAFYPNLIDYESVTQKYQNLKKVMQRSATLSLEQRWESLFKAGFEFTFLEAFEEESKLSLLRRPKWQGSSYVQHQTTEVLSQKLIARYVGARPDVNVLSQREELKQRLVWDFEAHWKVYGGGSSKNPQSDSFGHVLGSPSQQADSSWNWSFAVQNLFDLADEEVRGYAPQRQTFYLGLSWGV